MKSSIVVVGIALVGCSNGKPTSEVFKEHEPRMIEIMRNLTEVGAKLPAPSDPVKPCVKGAVTAAEIDVINFEQLGNREASVQTATGDLFLSKLHMCRAWFTPPAANTLRTDDSEANLFEKRAAACTGRTHVLVARELSRDAASSQIRYDLVRLADQTAICGFITGAKSDAYAQDYNYKLVERDSGKVVGGGYHNGTQSTQWTDARNALVAAAERELGVTIALNDDF